MDTPVHLHYLLEVLENEDTNLSVVNTGASQAVLLFVASTNEKSHFGR